MTNPGPKMRGSCWVYRFVPRPESAAAPRGPVEDHAAGVREVASPRHADVLLVCGECGADDADKLRRVWSAVPRPRIACLLDCPGGRETLLRVDAKAAAVELPGGIADGAALARAVANALGRPADGSVKP